MLENILTEKQNLRSTNFDSMSTIEALHLMNDEDNRVIDAVKSQLKNIESIIDLTTQSLKVGGRIIYIGAGTSGRLGVLDAVECTPTFGVSEGVVIGLIAGGESAFLKAVEGAEDSKTMAQMDLKSISITENDTIIGIAASGRTPYVISGLEYASKIGAKTAAISCVTDAEISKYASVAVELNNGPEVLSGSTRLKAGTSQKMVLNMISTVSMKNIGKIYQNYMVDVQPTNDKLIERSKRIIMGITNVPYDVAEKKYLEANKSVKHAVVMILNDCNLTEADGILKKTNGFIKRREYDK